MVAFVNVSITFNNQIILAGLLENTTGMPIPQKTADKAFKLTDENFTINNAMQAKNEFLMHYKRMAFY